MAILIVAVKLIILKKIKRREKRIGNTGYYHNFNMSLITMLHFILKALILGVLFIWVSWLSFSYKTAVE